MCAEDMIMDGEDVICCLLVMRGIEKMEVLAYSLRFQSTVKNCAKMTLCVALLDEKSETSGKARTVLLQELGQNKHHMLDVLLERGAFRCRFYKPARVSSRASRC